MHLSYAALLLLPLALAHEHEPGLPAHRRHHARAVVDANRVPNLPRAGAAIDNGTLASISAHDASVSPTQAPIASASATTSAAQDDDEDTVPTTTASSAADSGVLGGGPSSTISSATASSTLSSTSTSDLETSTTTSAQETTSTTSSSVAPSTAPTTELAPTTVTSAEAIPSAINSGTAHSSIILVTTTSRTQSTHSASSTAESAESEKKSSGLGKTALIAIIVVASVVGLTAIGWTLFRKWKLRPSNRFDKRMNPIDFSPHNDNMGDDFFEKTLQRSASNTSASRQRHELMAELDDPNQVPGVPSHDFTAGTAGVGAGAGAGVGAGVGAGYNMYNQDPYSHADQYEYDQSYTPHGYDQHQHQYPPQALTQDHQGYAAYGGAPSQDQPLNDGYADLHRGGSIGSGSGHGHAVGYQHGQAVNHDQGVYSGDLNFPSPDQYGGLGRPTGGAEGPYAQAAQYRAY